MLQLLALKPPLTCPFRKTYDSAAQLISQTVCSISIATPPQWRCRSENTERRKGPNGFS